MEYKGLITYLFAISFVTVLPLSACTSETETSILLREAKKAEEDGRVINNEMMSNFYPNVYLPGHPQYLERDFEAGGNLICDQIKYKYHRDICSESAINWR